MMRLTTLGLALMVLCGAVTLIGCGYELRGTTKKHPHNTSVALHTPTLLIFDDARISYDLGQMLSDKLELLGIKTTTRTETRARADASNFIQVSNVNIRRYELVGVLTEVRLVISADVIYYVHGSTHSHTLQAERSYQYNEAGVSATDQQAASVRTWLYQTLAERVSEQYYSLSKAQVSQSAP